MPQYNLVGSGESRVLTIPAKCAMTYRFWDSDGLRQVTFKQAGTRLIAAVNGKILVYKKPHSANFHKEYMLANSRAYWLGLQADPDMIIDNMLEYVETL